MIKNPQFYSNHAERHAKLSFYSWDCYFYEDLATMACFKKCAVIFDAMCLHSKIKVSIIYSQTLHFNL